MKVQVGFRLEDKIVDEVDKLAEGENRTRSNMVEVLLAEALRARATKSKAKGSA